MMKTVIALVVAVVLSLTAPVAYAKEKKPYNPGQFYTTGGKLYGSMLYAKFHGYNLPEKSDIFTKVKKCNGKYVRFKLVDQEGDFTITRKFNTDLFPRKMVFQKLIKSPGFKNRRTSETLELSKQYGGC